MKDPLSSGSEKIEFLKENENIKETTEDAAHPLPDEINSDDEVWIVQGPKTINVNQWDQTETVAEEFASARNRSIAVNSTGTAYTMKSLPVKGRLIVRNKLQHTVIDTKAIVDNSVKAPPFPANLKVHHPLLGTDYQKKINLSEEVRKKWKRAEEASKKSMCINCFHRK